MLQEGAELLNPQLRQFSELPLWMNANAERLEGRKVLMYCTGGVRCERASALLKGMGPGFQDVSQLEGGIQRYIERFVDGGFFRGKNFVFDERVTVPPPTPEPNNMVGACLLCHTSCDSYRPRIRCGACRLLILVCPDCEARDPEQLQQVECELCRGRREACQPVKPAKGGQRQVPISKKLRILCLHGFRQDARLMKDSLARFQREVADLVHLEFADAPHTLPFLYRPTSEQGGEKELPQIDLNRPRRAWLVQPSQAALTPADKERWIPAEGEISGDQYKRQTAGWPQTWEYLQNILHAQEPFDGILGFSQGAAVAAAVCATLQQQRSTCCCVGENGELKHPEPVSPSTRLKNIQPAEQSLGTGERELAACNLARGDSADAGEPAIVCPSGCRGAAGVYPCPRFVILASGFLSRAPETIAVQESIAKVNIPSLHVYVQEGGVRKDRQIPWSESKALEAWFGDKCKAAVQHSRGHFMPADKNSQIGYRKFLQAFL